MIDSSLLDPSWDLHKGSGFPSAISSYPNGVEVTEYSRFGQFREGIEPLVLYHEFHGLREDYVEISEEFRTFHRLYHDRRTNKFWKFDEDGQEQVVAEILNRSVKIRFREIREFLAVKEMHLALLLDSVEYSTSSLKDLGLDDGVVEVKDGLISYSLAVRDLHFLQRKHGRQSISRFLGKRLLQPMDRNKVPFFGYSPPKEFPKFLSDVDDDDNEIRFTCDPDQLGNYFGGNPNAPHYLTPVQFRKAVLDKYFNEPAKYEVRDSRLSCAGLWGVTIDNHHDDHVIVWLGDLGRDLPESEWQHWLSFNEPKTIKVSEPFFRRQILGQFADSDSVEHVFAQRYAELCRESEERLGWPLYLPLTEGDRHFLQGIRVPSNDEQKVFDELILSMTKVLVDSLNEKQLLQLLPPAKAKIDGGINRFEAVLAIQYSDIVKEQIKVLREMQSLRSKGAAHRKGSDYQQLSKALKLDEQPLCDVFRGLLQRSVDLLIFLQDALHAGAFDSKSGS